MQSVFLIKMKLVFNVQVKFHNISAYVIKLENVVVFVIRLVYCNPPY